MTYEYIPKIPDYNTPPDNYEVPDDYPSYYEELEYDNKRKYGEQDEDQL